MMASNDKTTQKLEQALTEAHQTRQGPRLGPDWGERVMRDVRRVAIQEARRSVSPGIESFVWRTATLAAAVALILTVSLVAWSWTPSNEGVDVVAEELESTPLVFD